jgi:hypothetical protein
MLVNVKERFPLMSTGGAGVQVPRCMAFLASLMYDSGIILPVPLYCLPQLQLRLALFLFA